MLYKMLDFFCFIISIYFLKKKNCCDVKSFFEIFFMEFFCLRCDYLFEFFFCSIFIGYLLIYDVGILCDYLLEDFRIFCGCILY